MLNGSLISLALLLLSTALPNTAVEQLDLQSVLTRLERNEISVSEAKDRLTVLDRKLVANTLAARISSSHASGPEVKLTLLSFTSECGFVEFKSIQDALISLFPDAQIGPKAAALLHQTPYEDFGHVENALCSLIEDGHLSLLVQSKVVYVLANYYHERQLSPCSSIPHLAKDLFLRTDEELRKCRHELASSVLLLFPATEGFAIIGASDDEGKKAALFSVVDEISRSQRAKPPKDFPEARGFLLSALKSSNEALAVEAVERAGLLFGRDWASNTPQQLTFNKSILSEFKEIIRDSPFEKVRSRLTLWVGMFSDDGQFIQEKQ